MEDIKEVQKEFSSQTDSYIKFLLSHLVFTFTVVFYLVSGVHIVEATSIEQDVEKVKSLEKVTGVSNDRLIKDDFLKTMYFIGDNASQINTEATSKDTPTYTQAEIDSLAKLQKDIIDDLENTYSRAFIIKVTFLGDVQIDLRTWIFFLPVLLILSFIYIFILDYKIVRLRKQSPDKLLTIEYPFKYLNPLLLFFEAVLLMGYIYALTEFLKYVDEDARNAFYRLYILIIYYALVYCCYLVNNQNSDPTIVYSKKLGTLFNRTADTIFKTIGKVNSLISLSTGQALLFITLFLVMSYDACEERKNFDVRNAVKGYELIFTKEEWNSALGYLSVVYKWLYVAIISFSVALTLLHISRFPLIRNMLLNVAKPFYAFVVLIFSISFSFQDTVIGLFYETWIILALLLYWYYAFYRRFYSKSTDLRKQLFSYIVFLAPLIILSIRNITTNSFENGWIWFYIGLWAILIAVVGLIEKKSHNASM